MTQASGLRTRLDGLLASGDSVECVDVLNELADTLIFAGEPRQRVELPTDAIAMSRRIGYAPGEALALFYLAAANWLVARLEIALATLMEADASFRALDDRAGAAKVRYMLAVVYRSLGDFDQSFLDALGAMEYFAASRDPRWEARSRVNLAATLVELGDFEGARKQHETTLELTQGGGEPWVISRTYSGLGGCHDAVGDHREALGFHLRALKTSTDAGYAMGQAKALYDLGQSYERLGERPKAIEFYGKSLRLREEIDQREAQCTNLIALGRLYADEDLEKGLWLLNRAREVAGESGAKPRLSQALLALSQAYQRHGNAEQALEHYKAYHDVHTEALTFTSRMRVKNLRTIFEAEKKARDAEMMQLRASVEGGTSLGSYRLVERLGAGGMGEVWRGEHRLLSRAAAVKVIRAQDAGRQDQHERLVERFRREAEVTSNLRSPHTVQLFDFGVSTEGTFHYVMELLDGMDTRQMVERFGPLPPSRLVHLLRQACRSLAEAHELGLVHRDIKPANLFVAVLGGEYDFLKVLDFGMVKKGPSDADVQLTAAGTTLGTPAFMAPELVSGDGPVDGRADLYALGCTAFWILTGMPVFQAKTETAMLIAHVNTPPPLVTEYSEVPIPRDLEALILQCLQKRPEARPASAVELGDRLGAIRCDTVWSAHDAREWWFAHAPQTGSRRQWRGDGACS